MAIPGSLLTRPEDEDQQNLLAMPDAAPAAPLAEGAGGTAASALQVVAPPATVDTTMTKGAQQNSTRTQVTPEHAEDINRAEAAAASEDEAAAREAFDKESAAAAEAFNAEKRAEFEQKRAAERAQAIQLHQQKVDAAFAQEVKARDEMAAAAKPHDYWEDRGAPARILSAFMTGLADYAHIRAGGAGPSLAAQQLDQEIARDRQTKLDRFMASKEMYQARREGTSAARELLVDHLKIIDAQEQAQREALTKQLEANSARFKVPMAADEAAKVRQENVGKRAESLAKLRETVAAKITNEGARKDTTHTDNTGNNSSSGPKDLTVFTLDGKPRQARSLAEAEKVRDANAAATGIGGAIADLKTHVLQHGRTNVMGIPLDTAVMAEREQHVSAVTDYLTTLKNTGVLNGGEYKRYKDMLDTSLTRGAQATSKALDVLKGEMDRHYNSNLMAKSIALPGEGGGEQKPAETASTDRPQGGRALGQKDAAALDWARKNKGDPRAAQILEAHGLRP